MDVSALYPAVYDPYVRNCISHPAGVGLAVSFPVSPFFSRDICIAAYAL